MSPDTQTAIATVIATIIANWVVLGPILSKAWKKAFEWHDLQRDLSDTKKDVLNLKQDVTAAHIKIRKLESDMRETFLTNRISPKD